MDKIEYINPIVNSFNRMQEVLFKPFDITKWFIIGFTAWLAHLLERGFNFLGTLSDVDKIKSLSLNSDAWTNFSLGKWELIILIIISGVILVVSVCCFVIIFWLNSRGKLMFLDNVVWNRSQVKDPWQRFAQLGNSLFKWRIVFSAIVLFLLVLFLVPLILGVLGRLKWGWSMWLVALIIGVFIFIVVSLLAVAGFINLLLINFVVPVMYKFGVVTNEAWKIFLPFLKGHFLKFGLYSLLIIALEIFTFFVIGIVVIVTCCIAGCLLAIPYIGSVFLLPVTVFFRFLGPEFLLQFSSDFNIFPVRNEGRNEGMV